MRFAVKLCPLVVLALTLSLAVTAQSPQKPDAATAAWWAQTVSLSNDSMEGRDTGSEAYERAAKYVADQFKSANLKPAGDNGTFFQRVPMHQVDLDIENSSVTVFGPIQEGGLVAGSAFSMPIRLLYETTVAPRESLRAKLTGELVFTGYGMIDPSVDLHGKIAVFYNNTPKSLSPAERDAFTTRRLRALTQAGAVAVVSIDNPTATEPTHWPAAYARSVTIKADQAAPSVPNQPMVLRISAEAAPKLFTAVNAPYQLSPPHPFPEILSHAEAGDPLESFSLFSHLDIKLATTSKDISSLAQIQSWDPSTSLSPPTSTATATARPSSATTSTTAPSTTQPMSRFSSSSPKISSTKPLLAACSFVSSPAKKRVSSARPTSPSTSRFRKKTSSPISTSTSFVPSFPSTS
jgi:hypothetical protein